MNDKIERWSSERANEWYRRQPWPCGFNYIPANAISYTEMWMPDCFDPRFIDGELALAERVGFNCVRAVLPFVVWQHDRNQGSTVESCLPVFEKANVGCMHWGLVNGRTQTHLAWGSRPGKPAPKLWQHDLYHRDHTPYGKREIARFRRCIGQARNTLLTSFSAGENRWQQLCINWSLTKIKLTVAPVT